MPGTLVIAHNATPEADDGVALAALLARLDQDRIVVARVLQDLFEHPGASRAEQREVAHRVEETRARVAERLPDGKRIDIVPVLDPSVGRGLHAGHQAQRPSTAIAAGSRTGRTTSASSTTAIARPVASWRIATASDAASVMNAHRANVGEDGHADRVPGRQRDDRDRLAQRGAERAQRLAPPGHVGHGHVEQAGAEERTRDDRVQERRRDPGEVDRRRAGTRLRPVRQTPEADPCQTRMPGARRGARLPPTERATPASRTLGEPAASKGAAVPIGGGEASCRGAVQRLQPGHVGQAAYFPARRTGIRTRCPTAPGVSRSDLRHGEDET